MQQYRTGNHPIIPPKNDLSTVSFTFNGKKMKGLENEVISSALFANNIKVFGHHKKDQAPQGIFCANGQCAQCAVVANGVPVKACMTKIEDDMEICSYDSDVSLENKIQNYQEFADIPYDECRVLVIGGGPAGISAAIELGKLGIDVTIADDKHKLGGKLLLQTHQFFGSSEDCYAGTRGIDIAGIMSAELSKYPSVKILINSPVVGVFADKTFGISTETGYRLVKPQKTIIATGAREKSIPFPGWDLPGVYGAGAFQTLMNRDLVKPSENLFIVGGGNVGLIAAYHALQAGINVCGLTEIMDKTGGYEVHSLKIKRMGVPLYLNHTVVSCEGDENGLTSVTICEVDRNYRKINGTAKKIPTDTLLLAVGLNPVEELMIQAKKMAIDVSACGDAQEIAEASAAIFSGKITGLTVGRELGFNVDIPEELSKKCDILKSRPGKTHKTEYYQYSSKVHPVIHCFQEIPCDPCSKICPHSSIKLKEDGNILSTPVFGEKCSGCGKCVLVCPGLAITLLDARNTQPGKLNVVIPYELPEENISENMEIMLTDLDGCELGKGTIIKILKLKSFDRRALVTVSADSQIAPVAAGFKISALKKEATGTGIQESNDDHEIICKCERITAREIKNMIHQGAGSLTELKTLLRCTMGACSGKTCGQLILRILKSEGIEGDEMSLRPLEMETPIGVFAGRAL